jgi:hypothetical protein
MKQIVELTELKPRADAIRWTLADVSLAAGKARSTAYQVVQHQNPTRSTHKAISDALITEEVRLLHHLAGLHPDVVTVIHKQAAE